jgi:hypothetical protein
MSTFSKADLDNAMAKLAMCQFFPREAATQSAIMELLAKMCPHKAALEWLVDTMVNKVGSWHGPAELRGVLSSRFRPTDGIEADCNSTPGFTPLDMERRYIEQAYELKCIESPRVRGLLASGEVIEEQHLALEEIGLDPQKKTMPRPRLADWAAAKEFAKRVNL